MIFFNEKENLYEEHDRPSSHGPILYIPIEVNSIKDLDESLLTKSQTDKLVVLFEKINSSNKRCFSAMDIAELFNQKFNSARAFFHKLKNTNICSLCEKFKHLNNKANGSLYLINSKSNSYAQQISENNNLTVISNINRHLLITGDTNPLTTPNLHVNDNELLKAFFSFAHLPSHIRLSSVIPISGFSSDNNDSFEVRHTETFSSSVKAEDPTTAIADIRRLRFLYLVINMTMSYFEHHRKSLILKDHVEAVCSLDRDQILTWLMLDKKHDCWKQYVDDNLKIWANTLFSSSQLIEKNWICDTTKPLFRIEKKLAHKKTAKFPQVYVLRWDVEALKYILKSKGPYLLPWTIISGSDFTFLLYLDARLKWPGKKSKTQRINYDTKQLMKIFPTVVGDEQVPQCSEKFAHFIVSSLHEHASRFNKYYKKNPDLNFKNEDKIEFYDRDINKVEFSSVIKNKRFISMVKAFIGGITFLFNIEGVGVNKRVLLQVNYQSDDVIRNSLPFNLLKHVSGTNNELNAKQLKARGYYSYSPQYYFSEELALHADKLVYAGFDYKSTINDSSANEIPTKVIEVIKDQYKGIGEPTPLLIEHAEENLPFLQVDKPPKVKPKTLRNFDAHKFVIAKFPVGKGVSLHHHLWITIRKDEPKLLLSYYSTDADIENAIQELIYKTGDFEDRIRSRVLKSSRLLQPIMIGEYLIDKKNMENLFNSMNIHLPDSLKLNKVDQLYTLISNNKKHITRYSQSVSPVDDPVAFTSLFKHYVK